jgi:hypothetical protein
MQLDDVEYYRARAATERERAEMSANAEVAAIHLELAIQYEALVEQTALRPTLHIAVPSAAAWRQEQG